MKIIQQIGLQAVEILTLFTAVLGMILSVMLLFSPRLTKSLSTILNRKINFDDKIGFLDKDIEIVHHLYNHHVVVGMLFIGGAAFGLFFFFFSLDVAKFTSVFLGSQQYTFVPEILIDSIIWIGKVACLIALLYGVLLVFAPGKMGQVEGKLNSWFETGSLIEKFDKTDHDFDSFIFRHPIMVGVAGSFLSFFLLSLSIANLLD
jgi:hypothetical protein